MRLWILAGTLGVLILAACRPRNADNQLMHALDTPVREDTPWLWHEIPFDSQVKFSRSLLGSGTPLAESDPIVTRLQWWIDLFDQSMRTRHPDEFKSIPRPRPIVMSNRKPDAYAMSVPVCYDVQVVLDPSATPASGTSYTVSLQGDQILRYLDPRSVVSGTYSTAETSPDCTPVHLDDKEVATFVDWVNGFYSSCKLKLVSGSGGRPKVALDTGCTASFGSPPASTIGTASSLSVMTMTNWITITTGMLKLITNEESVVSFLAHELGHYYRAHPIAPSSEYRYPYEAKPGDANFAGKPTPPSDPAEAKELRAIIAEISRYRGILPGVAAVPGQKIASDLFEGLVELANGDVRSLCRAGSACEKSCAPLITAIDTPGFVGTSGYFGTKFPKEALPASKEADYLNFESFELSCFAAVPYKESGVTGGLGEIDVSIALSRAIPRLSSIAPSIPDMPTLKDVVEYLEKKISDSDQKLQTAYKRAADKWLGIYTEEQEADEIGAEIDARVGLDLLLPAHAILDLGVDRESREGPPRPPELSIKQCRDLVDRGLKDDKGNFVYIQIGDLRDFHHSYCYRAVNFYREMQAHNYSALKPGGKPTPPGKNWADLLKEL